ncbi:uracil-DNA glycosylase family protein [Aureitalea sp. L0-47]|uniref:uracil-DNA glycosylase family protein n=1 Tax=Aureitalea sp. L0-47 TaxID=2816962 RepID=UPI0022373175|nr:uracil-DNA glycosylase family protein [Aureitalea sp. L0-47]MCW5521153.1 uracil-DNA glycosylase family protein [Aureitalea sp. L0-47]
MFLHAHPYPPFIPENTEKLIVGTLPPPRFTTRELKEGDVDFCYGSRDGQLWPILDKIFNLNLSYETTAQAVEERKQFLIHHKIGICDIVESAFREKIDASDLGMQNAKLRDLVSELENVSTIHTLLFTGGNSKNGPEYFFRKLIRNYNIELKMVSNDIPRIHEFRLPKSGRTIRTVSLIAPSGAANRAVGSLSAYKQMKADFPEKNTIDFRVMQYSKHFRSE